MPECLIIGKARRRPLPLAPRRSTRTRLSPITLRHLRHRIRAELANFPRLWPSGRIACKHPADDLLQLITELRRNRWQGLARIRYLQSHQFEDNCTKRVYVSSAWPWTIRVVRRLIKWLRKTEMRKLTRALWNGLE
jgi:hypothetical protein